jgi:hypothetical protein
MKPALILLVCAAMSLFASAAPASLSVTVVGADSNDPRWHAVAEAVEFWNQQLADTGVSVRLGPITRLVQPVPDDVLRQLSEGRSPIASIVISHTSSSKFQTKLSWRSRRPT